MPTKGIETIDEVTALRARLAEAEQALAAIRNGEVDALVIGGADGDYVFTLKDADRPYRLMVEQMQEGAATVANDGTVLYCNQRLADMLGLPLERVMGRGFAEVIEPSCLAVAESAVAQGGKGASRVECNLQRADGAPLPVNLAISPLPEEFAGCVCVIFTDLTSERKSQELETTRRQLAKHRDSLQSLVDERTAELESTHERLRFVERMAAIGTLSAGLGHDLANLLLPVRVRIASLLERGLSAADHADIVAIGKATDYLQRLAAGLRLLVLDPEQGSGDSVLVGEWWGEAESILRAALPVGIMLNGTACVPEVCVGMSKSGLTQVVFNLVQNAGEAMRQRGFGRVTVSCRQGPGGITLLTVADDGPGMEREARVRCMEPFFTTKSRALSTGMGLAIVAGLVKRAGGRVELETESGAGCTFILVLPHATEGRKPGLVPELGLAPGPALGPALGLVPAAQMGGTHSATVSIGDDRSRAHITAVLSGLGFGARVGPAAGQDDVVWVVDGDCDAANIAALTFLEAREHRRVVVIGDAAPSWSHPRAVVLAGSPRPTAVREALQRLAGGLRSDLETKGHTS